ncbi:hypothetical protein [Humibacter sp.]|jgi:hypothetical protein|uniref:hypothetical protein n=1 Tax=Humibacter sp. TaxID=1940291 RepID=UPI002C5742FD|nr:hypothetical protein [Humibacter sp.]HVX09363.1 hypothetical protein [Humibacter sp.]
MIVPEAKPPYLVWDIVVSVITWLVTGAFIGMASFIAVFGLAFLDYCPPQSCSAEAAVACLFAAGTASVVVALAGFVWGLVRMFHRQPSWWMTVGAFVLCVGCWAGGFVSAARAVGW